MRRLPEAATRSWCRPPSRFHPRVRSSVHGGRADVNHVAMKTRPGGFTMRPVVDGAAFTVWLIAKAAITESGRSHMRSLPRVFWMAPLHCMANEVHSGGAVKTLAVESRPIT